MIQWFKKWLVAHEANNHEPHILRKKAISFFIVFIFAIETVYLFHVALVLPGVVPGIKNIASIIPGVLTDETNATRLKENLDTLTLSPLLQKAAQEKANDMAQKGYFSHISSDGVTPWHWFDDVGYKYIFAGENLAINFIDSDEVINAWMNSPTHRANILDNRFTEIGIATAEGTYQGRNAIFVVQLFGKPLETNVLSIVTPVALASNQETVKTITPTRKEVISPESILSSTSISAVKGEATSRPLETNASRWKKIASQPKATTESIEIFVGLIVVAVFFLNFAFKAESRHPHLLLNCMILVGVIMVAYLFNNYLIVSHLQIV